MSEVLTGTQIVEFAQAQVGEESTTDSIEGKYWDLLNEVYLREFPMEFTEFDFMREDMTPINVVAPYTTGTVSVSGTTVTGSGTTFTSAMANRKFKVDNDDDVYVISSFGSTTSLTLNRTWQGSSDSGLSFTIFEDIYDTDTDLFVPTLYPGVYYRDGSSIHQLKWIENSVEWAKRKTSQVGTPNEFRIDIDRDSDRSRRIEINPPPSAARTLYGEWIKRFTRLYEYVVGTATLTQGATTCTGSSTRWNSDSNVAVGDFIRIDNTDPYISQWYRISAINSDTSMTLASNFQAATQTAKSYTVASVPDMPRELHHALKWSVCATIALSLGDTQRARDYSELYQRVVSDYKSLMSRIRSSNVKGAQRMRTVWERPTLRRGR